MLVLSLICGVLCCFAFIRGGVIVLSQSKSGRRRGWLQLLIAPTLGVASVAFYDASPQVYTSSALADIGLALMLSAAVLAAWMISEGNGRPIGWRGVRGLAIGLMVFGLGYGFRIVTAVRQHGWWAGMPTTGLVLLTPWLPEEAIWSGYTRRENGTLQNRMTEIGAATWRSRMVRTSLENRYRAELTERWRDIVVSFYSNSAVITELDGAHLARLAKVFCETSDLNERRSVAWTLNDYSPLGGKITRPHLGVLHGPAAFHGRLPRLLELMQSDDYLVASTALDALAYFPDDSPELVPFLVAVAGEDVDDISQYTFVQILQYFAKASPAAQSQLISLACSAHGASRLVAYEALDGVTDTHSSVRDCAVQLLRESSDELALTILASHRFASWNSENCLLLLQQAEKRPDVRAAIIRLMKPYLPCAEAVLAALQQWLESDSPGVREAACDLLYRFALLGPHHVQLKRFSGPVQRLRFDADPAVQQRAERAWREMYKSRNW
jgi:hypothetical protein